MMYETMDDEEKQHLKRARKDSEGMSNRSSGSDSESSSSSSNSLNKVPLMKLVTSNVEDLDWDVETGKGRENASDDSETD